MLKISNFISGCRSRYQVRNLLTLSLGLMTLAISNPPQSHAQETPQDMNSPELELIEFVGLFEDDDMGWVDPFTLQETEQTTVPDSMKGDSDE